MLIINPYKFAPPVRTLLRTAKINFGNNFVQQPAGYNIMNGTDDDNLDVINLNDTSGNATGWTLTNITGWTGALNGDTTNATTGDLAAAILESYHLSGANNADSVGKQLGGLDNGRYYTVKIVSVAATTTTVGYDTFWKLVGVSNTIETTIDPHAQRTTPSIINLGEVQPSSGVITLYGREPTAENIYLTSMIIEEYNISA